MLTSKRMLLVAVIVAASGFLLASISQLAFAANQAVELLGIEAIPAAGNTVEVRFATGSEDDARHWFIQRSETGVFSPTTALNWMDQVITVSLNGVSTQIVTATGSSGVGAQYVVIDQDPTLVPGQTYWYTLVEVQDSNGIEISHANDHKDDAQIGAVPTHSIDLTQIVTGPQIAAGGTTTHVVRMTNTGTDADYNDFRAQLANQTSGWSSTVGGIPFAYSIANVDPNGTQLLTVTVTAPGSASAGDQSSVQLTVNYDVPAWGPNITYSQTITLYTQIESDAFPYKVFTPLVFKQP